MYSDIPITHDYYTHDCAGAMYMHVCTECWSVSQEWQDVLDGLSSDMVVKAMGVVRKRPSENINKVYVCMRKGLGIYLENHEKLTATWE